MTVVNKSHYCVSTVHLWLSCGPTHFLIGSLGKNRDGQVLGLTADLETSSAEKKDTASNKFWLRTQTHTWAVSFWRVDLYVTRGRPSAKVNKRYVWKLRFSAPRNRSKRTEVRGVGHLKIHDTTHAGAAKPGQRFSWEPESRSRRRRRRENDIYFKC